MSRFELYVVANATDPTVVRVFDEIQRELGFGIVPNVFRAMASNPGVLEANWMLFRAVVLKGRLPRVLKEMVGVVVSTVHESRYARLVHLHSLSMQAVSGDTLAALADGRIEGVNLPPASIAVLKFARAAAASPRAITARQFADLREVGLSDAEVFEVVSAIELFTAVNAFTDLGDIPVDGA